jgi:hypothetical protein
MSVDNILASAEAQAFAASIASKYGISQQAASGAMAALLPAMIGGLERNTMSREGIAGLMQALASGHHYNVIANPEAIGQAATLADGNAVIGHLLGPGGLPPAALQAASRQSGVPLTAMSGIAPMVAVFVLGWLFRNAGPMLGNILGGAARSAMGSGGGGMSMPQMPGIPNMGGASAGGGMPFPRSGGGGPLSLPDIKNFDTSRNNPYGNIADSIRRGTIPGGAGAATGGIRDILGSLLGFGSSKGWMGWIIKFIVLRYGWTILRSVLGAALGGRR